MASSLSLGSNLCVINSGPNGLKRKTTAGLPSVDAVDSSALRIEFRGKQMVASQQKTSDEWSSRCYSNLTIHAQATSCISRALRWWDKNLKPNIAEINSAQELVDSLSIAGDKLVVLDFYSSGCGGCKALHPKICRIAEANPNVQFLKVNYEEQRSLCTSLHIHVLPFFRFYRGTEGRVSSFSCTIQTIKKFKDAIAKHGTDRCSLGPAKGLEESELLELAAEGLLSFHHRPGSANSGTEKSLPSGISSTVNKIEQAEELLAALAL
ncbi:thioredoxin-like 1-1, chloroplastic [Aristolochia californica]|uniref:thioredoxin-like 1-1, chloroplastic n=1 Tax=Aristolochia californica TaxID=171875 RepID=UPI0035DB6A64